MKQEMNKPEKADANKIRNSGLRLELSGAYAPKPSSQLSEGANGWECREYGRKCSSHCKPNRNWLL